MLSLSGADGSADVASVIAWSLGWPFIGGGEGSVSGRVGEVPQRPLRAPSAARRELPRLERSVLAVSLHIVRRLNVILDLVRLEPVIFELERCQEDLLIIGHASVIRCLVRRTASLSNLWSLTRPF